jgi:hypothetical protein
MLSERAPTADECLLSKDLRLKLIAEGKFVDDEEDEDDEDEEVASP